MSWCLIPKNKELRTLTKMDVNFSPINSGYINSFRYLNIGEIPYIYMKFGENSPICISDCISEPHK